MAKIKIKKETDQDISYADRVLNMIDELPAGMYEVVVRKPVRTSSQNRSLHVFVRWISQALNEAGISMTEFYKEGADMMWTPDSVKDHIWRVVQKAAYGKDSSAKLTTAEHSRVVTEVQQIVSRKGVLVNYPNEQDLINNIDKYEII